MSPTTHNLRGTTRLVTLIDDAAHFQATTEDTEDKTPFGLGLLVFGILLGLVPQTKKPQKLVAKRPKEVEREEYAHIQDLQKTL